MWTRSPASSPLVGAGSRALPPCDGIPLSLQKGSPQYQLLTVPEHSPRGTLVGNVTGAVDADEGSNAIVYYFIAGGAGWHWYPTCSGLGMAQCACPLTLCMPPLQPGTRRRISNFSPTGVSWC